MRISLPILVLAFFMSAAAFAGPLGDAAKKGDVAEIERLLALGVDANESGGVASPLHWAAMNGHADAVRLLASKGARLDAQSSMLGTPLHAAARFGRVEAVGELLATGADPNVRDRDKFTPLMRAVLENRQSVVGELLSRGADVNAVGNASGGYAMGRGPTIALQLAIREGHDEIADLLIAAGAGPIPPDVPEDLAARGDSVRGRELAYTYCEECHAIEAGDEERAGLAAGPPLIGIIGRPVADLGFEYSKALIAHSGTWTPERFYAFALTPTLTVPGTNMNWAPDRTPDMIADITAYFVSELE